MSLNKAHTFFQSSKGAIAYEVHGHGEWVVFCHALATNKRIWDKQITLFAKEFSVLTYDLPGHGDSELSIDNDYSFIGLSDQLIELMDHLDIKEAHLVGLSVGGEVAQVAASRYPNRFRSLVLVSTGCFTSVERKAVWEQRISAVTEFGMPGIAELTAERWFSSEFSSSHSSDFVKCCDWISYTKKNAYLGLVKEIQELDLRLTNQLIRCPTLIISGANDANTGTRAASLIGSTIPRANLCEISGAGHFPNLEKPAEFNQILFDFIA